MLGLRITKMKIIKVKKNLKTFIVIFLPTFLILYPAYVIGIYCPGISCNNIGDCPTYYSVGSTCYYSLYGCSGYRVIGDDICSVWEVGPGLCGYANKCIIPPNSCSNSCTVSIGACSESGCVTYYSYCAPGYVCSNGACVSGSCGTSPCPSD